MAYTIHPLTDHETGVEVTGIDLTSPVDAAARKALNDAFVKFHVLVIRDQKMTAAQFADAGSLFGEIMSQHHKDVRATGHPEVFEIRNEKIGEGKYRIAGESFHTDHSNHPVPPKATALFTVSLPSYGGDTQFVNMHNAYDDLSADMKRRVDNMRAYHVWESKYSPRKMRPLAEQSKKALPPPALHPIVRLHPENGRKALYLNPVRMESIPGMPDEEALALIKELMDHATQKKYEYRHKWHHGDMVIWDNRSVMHQANGDYDMNELRHLYRLMLVGEAVLPRVSENIAA